MAKLQIVKPQSPAEKTTRSIVDTMILTKDIIAQWQVPGFQRPLKLNDKVKALAEKIKSNGGVIPGVLVIGLIGQTVYRVDGQHRLEAFLLSGIEEGYADVRTIFCDNMGEMGKEFVDINSRITPIKADDILRGYEGSYPVLAWLRKQCPFVGYDQIRRGTNSPIVSMSSILRIWRGSASEVPVNANTSAAELGATLTDEDAQPLAVFLNACMTAWGKDQQYGRLWGGLNLVLCAWLFRRLVMTQYSPRTPRLTKEVFRQCLMSLSADETYVDWLVGRNKHERDRSPAYERIKRVFIARIQKETGTKPSLPAPAWFTSR